MNNKISLLKELVNLANDLDAKGFRKEAGQLDKIIRKASEEEPKYYLHDNILFAEVSKITGEIVCAKWISDDQSWEICDTVPSEAKSVNKPSIVPAFESVYGF